MALTDTIAAPITALGGAVGVIRVSGLDAWSIARKGAPFLPPRPRPRHVYYGLFAHGDDGLATLFASDSSYTGEPVAELSVHGSVASVQNLLQFIYVAGARPAEPGEFTLRAFMSGRIDLTQAEGVRETVTAQTDAQLRAANALREGAVHAEVTAIRTRVISALGEVEARIDFEEEVGPLNRPELAEALGGIAREAQTLANHSDRSRYVREGIRIVLAGRPNSGKSSLLNALLNQDRAIVTDVPGTTRDTLAEQVFLAGMAVTLIDTAGLRDGVEAVERIGIQRTQDAIRSADAVWFLYDAAVGWTQKDEDLWSELKGRKLVLANKVDLATDATTGTAISASQRVGFEQLEGWIDSEFGGTEVAVPTLPRHAVILRRCAETLQEASIACLHHAPPDLLATLLQSAVYDLGQITGESADEDLLQRIFSEFCIGK